MNQSTRLLNHRALRTPSRSRTSLAAAPHEPAPFPPHVTSRRRPMLYIFPHGRCFSSRRRTPFVEGPTPLAAFNSLLHRHPIQAHPRARVFVGTFSSSFIPSATTSVYRRHHLPLYTVLLYVSLSPHPATCYILPHSFSLPPLPTRHDSSRLASFLLRVLGSAPMYALTHLLSSLLSDWRARPEGCGWVVWVHMLAGYVRCGDEK
ncbi:hypothetical protein C8R47DRAFT_530305 [Mycena vitilis]|nr:hypothetical protein C8R47DRAFT_530305 [Mycena vitilis]